MDKKLKAKWLRALRGGKIEQARGVLADDEGRMCCVGVLEHVAGMEVRVLRKSPRTLLPTSDCLGVDLEIRRTLAGMNDGENKFGAKAPRRSFKTIAKWIEKHL